MAGKLIGKTVRTRSRKAVGDMASRNDAILEPEIFTSIVHHLNRNSPLAFFGGLVGGIDPLGNYGEDPYNQMVTLQSSGLGASYINIKEECEVYEPLIVTDNSKVPTTITANVPFDFTVDRGILDPDENFLLRDQKTMGRVISRSVTPNGALITAMLDGQRGETFNGPYLFEVGAYVNYGYGNSQGEGSHKSNLMALDAEQYNTFFNPMVITRYVLPVTGSWMSDEMFTLTQKAMDGSESEVNTGISVQWMRKFLNSYENMIMFSRSNFDPATKEILGRNSNAVRYNERPSYAGIYEQFDEAPVKWKQPLRAGSTSGIQKINSIMRTLKQMPGHNGTFFAMGYGVGIEWLRETIREGGLNNSMYRIVLTPDSNDAITAGFNVDKYVLDGIGVLYIYDIGNGMHIPGKFDTVTYNQVTSTVRSRDIFFFSSTVAGRNGKPQKVAKLYTKEGQVEGFGKVNRGLVFGSSRGLTGEYNGLQGQAALSMQVEQAMRSMLNSNGLGSIVDGNEYHALTEHTVYVDPRGTVKLSLVGN